LYSLKKLAFIANVSSNYSPGRFPLSRLKSVQFFPVPAVAGSRRITMKRRSQRSGQAVGVELTPLVGGLGSMVPDEGFEPPTFGLQSLGYSLTE